MLSIRNLLLLPILVMSSAVGFFYVKRMGLVSPFAVEVHNIKFDTKSCVECPICSCKYIVDNKTIYELPPESKTLCDVNPLGTYSAKIRDALLEEKDTVSITLKGAFYESFTSCLEAHAKQ